MGRMDALPSLDSLRVFEAVVRTGSLSRAAEEMGVTHGAISRKMAALERDLGLALLERASRGSRPTALGRVLYDAVRKALSDISATVDRILLGPDRQPFLVSCERSIALKWLIPRLSSFQDDNPGILVYLSTGGGRVDFDEQRLDVAIRRADFPMDPDWHVMPFMEEYVGPVMRPDLAAKFDAGEYVRIHSTTRTHGWRTWADLAGERLLPVADQYFDHFFLCLEAALSGLGVAVVPYAIAIDAVTDGRLAAPRGFVPDGSEYCLIATEPFSKDPRKARFFQWLRMVAPDPKKK